MIQISKYNKQHPLRVFEAFAGYGSQSLAFKYLKDKHPEFDFKVGKRISKAHKAIFTNKTMVIWYKGNKEKTIYTNKFILIYRHDRIK